jgi:hypothetical protein
VGALFGVLAAWLIYTGIRIETAVPSPDAPTGFDGVVNLQAMHYQAMLIHLGVGAAIVAAVLLVGSALIRPSSSA